MKKFTSLLIGCSLALAGIAFAQQPEEQTTPGPGKKGKEKTTQQAEPKTPKTRGGNTANPEATAKTGAVKEPGAAATEPGAGKGRKAKTEKSATATGTETGVSGQTGNPPVTEPAYGKGRKGKAAEKSTTATGAETNVSPQPTASAAPGGKHQRSERGMKATGAKASPSATAATAASASAAPTVAATGATGQQNAGANVAATGGTTTHVEKQKVQQVKQQAQTIKQQHVNFKAQPRPDKAPPVQFNASFRTEVSHRCSSPQS